MNLSLLLEMLGIFVASLLVYSLLIHLVSGFWVERKFSKALILGIVWSIFGWGIVISREFIHYDWYPIALGIFTLVVLTLLVSKLYELELRKTFSFLFSCWIVSLLMSVLLYFPLVSFFPVFEQIGSSMKPTLADGDKIVVYNSSNLQRGDIIVFHPPTSKTEVYLKRIVGLPGDSVHLKKGIVMVNEKVLQEPYITPGLITCSVALLASCDQDDVTYQVPENSYFVLGDNRSSSSDSRAWYDAENKPTPFIQRSNIIGKMILNIFSFSSVIDYPTLQESNEKSILGNETSSLLSSFEPVQGFEKIDVPNIVEGNVVWSYFEPYKTELEMSNPHSTYDEVRLVYKSIRTECPLKILQHFDQNKKLFTIDFYVDANFINYDGITCFPYGYQGREGNHYSNSVQLDTFDLKKGEYIVQVGGKSAHFVLESDNPTKSSVDQFLKNEYLAAVEVLHKKLRDNKWAFINNIDVTMLRTEPPRVALDISGITLSRCVNLDKVIPQRDGNVFTFDFTYTVNDAFYSLKKQFECPWSEIKSAHSFEQRIILDTSELPKGTYFLKDADFSASFVYQPENGSESQPLDRVRVDEQISSTTAFYQYNRFSSKSEWDGYNSYDYWQMDGNYYLTYDSKTEQIVYKEKNSEKKEVLLTLYDDTETVSHFMWNEKKDKVAFAVLNIYGGHTDYPTGSKIFVLSFENGKLTQKQKYDVSILYVCGDSCSVSDPLWYQDAVLKYFSYDEENEDGSKVLKFLNL